VLDLNHAVEEQRHMLARLIGEDVELRVRASKALWSIRIDPTQVVQVLANLVVNARDAIADVGVITIETSNVEVAMPGAEAPPDAAHGEYVLLAVSDTGSGMDEAVRERIFEPFFTTKQEGKGTGLGLSTVYGIVRQNGGFIHVESEPDRGSTFRLYFPRAASQAEAAPAPAPPGPAAGNETVLVVEDEKQILAMIAEELASRGYRVLAAPSPAEAITMAEAHHGRVHLLVTDVIMPMMNGRELKTRLEELRPGIRTLFMSGYTADVIAHRGILDEGIDFLAKPFRIADLTARVREILDRPDPDVRSPS
jgi:CheY-like chemotaxis protein